MKAKSQTFSRFIAVVATTLLLLIGVSWSQDPNPPQGQSHDQDVNPKNPPAQNPNESPSNESDIQKRVHAAARALDDIMGVKDKAIPDKVMKDAKCIAVIPSTVKIAVGLGGSTARALRPAARVMVGALRLQSPSPVEAGVSRSAERPSISSSSS